MLRPRTVAAGEAMLRAAVEAATEWEMERSDASVPGYVSLVFIPGLAGALGACALSTTCCACSTCTKKAISAHQSCCSLGKLLHQENTWCVQKANFLGCRSIQRSMPAILVGPCTRLWLVRMC